MIPITCSCGKTNMTTPESESDLICHCEFYAKPNKNGKQNKSRKHCDYVSGSVSGKAKILHRSRSNPKYFWFECVCGRGFKGKRREVSHLVKQSCGCMTKKLHRRFRVLNPIDYAKNQQFRDHKNRARKRNKTTSLTKDEYWHYLTQDCVVCGIPPKQSDVVINYKNYFDGTWDHRQEDYMIYKHTVDRIDSSKGYELGNVQTLCLACNIAKGDRSQQEFESWIQAIINNS